MRRIVAGCGLLFSAFLASGGALADERAPVVVTQPGASVYHAAVQRFLDTSPGADPSRTERFRQEIKAGLEYSSLFKVIDPSAFLAAGATTALDAPLQCPEWAQIGADALVAGVLSTDTSGLTVEFRVSDVSRCRPLRQTRIRAPVTEWKRVAHRIADEIVADFTGRPGVSSTEIAYVSNKSGTREIWIADADGQNARQATRNGSINAFPGWSSDGNTIVYTSYREAHRPGLFVLTRGGGRPGRILRGLEHNAQQFRGVFDPTGRRLAVVMSIDGQTDIFVVDRDGRNLRRLTNDRSIEVSPSWSPDGSRIAFVSDRAGGPQIYVMDADGSNVRRLTFQGDYNTGCSWSPDGRWIAYETRVAGQFDIWLIDPDGTTNVPLVTNPRTDEGASWSPDGRKIVFSSTRRGRADLYVVDVPDGGNLRQLTSGAGDNTSPAWGPYLPELR
jgi:TolB protein